MMLKFLRLNHFSFTIMILLSVTSLSANPFNTPFPFQEGIIHYTISGSEQGSRTVYFKDYGKEQFMEQILYGKIMHASNKQKIRTYTTPQWVYTFQNHRDIISKQRNIISDLAYYFETLTQEEKTQLCYHDKNDDILGFDTMTFTNKGVKYTYSKKGQILLKSQTHILGYSLEIVATSIEFITLDSGSFNLPHSSSIVEIEEDFNALEIIESLLYKK